MTEWIEVASLNDLDDERPASARVLEVSLVVVREGAGAHVLHSLGLGDAPHHFVIPS